MRRSLLLLTCLLTAASARAQLAGTYTVGGASPAYATPAAAAAAVTAQGVSGPVTFEIRPGTYDGAVVVGVVAGASETNTVRFTASDPASRPTLRHTAATAGTNWVVRLDGADHVTLENLIFVAAAPAPTGRLLALDASPEDVVVRGCAFTGLAGATTTDATLLVGTGSPGPVRLLVEDNTFTNGYGGLDVNVTTPAGAGPGVRILGNTFTNQFDLGLGMSADGRVEGNLVTNAPPTSTTYQGIRTGATTAVEVVGNRVALEDGGSGIDGIVGTLLIANNAVSVRGLNGTKGIYATGGLVAHNTVRAEGNADALALPLGPGTDIVVRNNILVADRRAIIDSATNSIVASDGNDLYTTGGTLVFWGGTSHATLAAWQAVSGFDGASVSVPVTFASTGATPGLHLAGASASDPALRGAALPEVPTDIDGDPRGAPLARMGADEGVPQDALDNADTPGGFYTVAGVSPDFATPQAFFDALAARGMKGPVTVRIRAGTFPLHTSLDASLRVGPAAADPDATPLIIRAANPSNRPVLASGATPGENWSLRLDGLDAVRFERLTFDATGAGDAGRLLVLGAGADELGTDDLTITDCTFAGTTTGISASDRALVWSEANRHDRLSVVGSRFNDGWAGIYISTPFSPPTPNPDPVITGNEFVNQSNRGILFTQPDRIVLSDNTFTSPFSPQTVVLGYNRGYTVTGNRFAVTGTNSIGLFLLGSDADASDPGLVANNFVRAATPILLSTGATGARIVHNTLYASSTPLWMSASDDVAELSNNILHSSGGTAAIRIETIADLGASDGNVLWSEGGSALVRVGATTYATLADWQAASGQDLRSESFAAGFADPATGDLHLDAATDGDVRLAGIPGTGVTTDYDGDARSAAAPYIGADEGTVPLPGEVRLTISVRLEGAHPDGFPMRNALATAGRLPLAQPYADPAFDGTAMDHDGAESVEPGFFATNPDFVDWVLVGLRATPAGPDLARRALLLHTNSSVRFGATGTVLTFPVPPGSYHVVVYHRNHLPLMSVARSLSFSAITSVSLTSASGVVGGAAAGTLLPGTTVLALTAGDADADGVVGASDRTTVWRPQTGAEGYRAADLDLDGLVLADDVQRRWAPNEGRVSNVPGAAPAPTAER